MPRTASIVSNVGPAVISTRAPRNDFGARKAMTASAISRASSMRPMPTSPHAWSPLAGPRIATPSRSRRSMLRRVAGLSHIWRFIAGATISGHSRARHSVESRSSARPCASLAMKSAVAGATTIASLPRESSMCAMLSATRASQRLVYTGLARERLESGGRDQAAGGFGHDDLHFDAVARKLADKLGGLVGGDTAGDAEHDRFFRTFSHLELQLQVVGKSVTAKPVNGKRRIKNRING